MSDIEVIIGEIEQKLQIRRTWFRSLRLNSSTGNEISFRLAENKYAGQL
jgi:hypothetical protein